MITVRRIEDLPPGESIRVADGVAAPIACFNAASFDPCTVHVTVGEPA